MRGDDEEPVDEGDAATLCAGAGFKSVLQLPSEFVESSVAPHLQVPPMSSDERRSILARYAKLPDAPEPLQDTNKVATNGVSSALLRHQIARAHPAMQRQCLDIVHVLANGFSREKRTDQWWMDCFQLAMDNALHLGRLQLQLALKAKNQDVPLATLKNAK